MASVEEAQVILTLLGIPKAQQNERSAITLLALAGLGPSDEWQQSGQPLLRIVDIMSWMTEQYNKLYAPNSRETIRRSTIHQFEQARLVDRNSDDPERPTNSGNTNYRLTDQATKVICSYGSQSFITNRDQFLSEFDALAELYEMNRDIIKIPITLSDGTELTLSPGDHNILQKRIVEDFGPRFAPGAKLAYLGDTANKLLHVDSDLLRKLNIPEMNHDKLPDVVLYDSKKNWLLLIEAVTSHGPVSPKRFYELEKILETCPANRVYVTAFMDFDEFKRNAEEVCWETEVWISDVPDHMVHFNGDKFLGPASQ